MSELKIQKRLKRARQRTREKYEAVKARVDRNDQKIKELTALHGEVVAKHEEYVSLTRGVYSQPDETEREHKANERSMRRSTWVIAVFTIVLGAVGIIGAVISAQTLYAIRGQLEAMESDQRPWVKLDSLELKSGLIFDSSGLAFNLGYKLENVGHSVALHAVIYVHLIQEFERHSENLGPTETSIDEAIRNYRIPSKTIDDYLLGHTLVEDCNRRFDQFIANPSAQAGRTMALANTIFPNDSISRTIPVIGREEGLGGTSNLRSIDKFGTYIRA